VARFCQKARCRFQAGFLADRLIELLTSELYLGDRENVDKGGISHLRQSMGTLTIHKKRKLANALTVVDAYDIAADAKKRISLRKAKAKYFHVQALSNGSFLLEPRVLVPMKVRIDKIEAVELPERLQPLMNLLGQALDRLPV
jgi:hypothetical protein